MSDALVVVLIGVLLVALATLVIVVRRRPPAPAPFDEEALRRLVQLAMSAPGPDGHIAESRPEPEADLSHFALLSHEATAAAEAADVVRRTASEAADELRDRSRREAEQLRADALAEAERTVGAARAQAAELRAGLDSERSRIIVEATAVLAEDRRELQEAEQRLRAATDVLADEQQALVADRRRIGADQGELNAVKSGLQTRAEALEVQAAELTARAQELNQRERDLLGAAVAQQAELTRISGLTVEAARLELLSSQEEEVRRDAAMMIRRIESEAQASAKQRARAIVAEAIQRVASDQTAQTVVAVVHLPADEVKGRIIGREGRNIRTLENLTGIDFIIDDTPNAVVLSSFDGLRREVARLTLTKLIEDGRIHPARIEEMYYQSKAEIEDVVRQAGEQAVFEANCGPFHEELVRILGRLRFRTSYGQNVLKHTLEVVHLAGIMATELGASVQTAKRAAMLHDLGKAMTHEIEGSHAAISAQFARRYGESQGVVHAVEAHHYEVQPQTVEAVLVISADAISASRPGARGESLEHYIKRLESLEQLAAAKPGVDKVYALQAGREIRVIVRPTEVDDDLAALLSHEIAREIEDQLEYPGQVKVTVIRESRSIDVARNHTTGSNGDGERRALEPPIETAPVPLELDPGSLESAPLDARPIEDSPSQAA